jgi:hypothetical protein
MTNALSTEYIHFTANSIALRQLRTQADGSIENILSAAIAASAKESNVRFDFKKSKVAVQKSLDEAQLLFDSLMQQYFG